MNFLRIYGKRFATTSKTLKFQNVNKDIKLNTHKLDTKVFEDNLRVAKTGPEKGEFWTLPTMPSKSWALSMGYNDAFKRDPVSAYYSIKVKDTMFHVFNAARYPLGRMAAKIAFIIQGKDSPHYRPNKVEPNTDRCIILNAKNVYLTGNKLQYKMYRHHSGYPGGLKEISAKHYIEKDCKEMIMRTIKGMIPKNKMRLLFLSKVKIYEEPGHDLHHLGLPQFASVQSLDYNDILGNNFSKKDLIVSNSNVSPDQIDELFPQVKHLKKELKEGYMKPEYMRRERDPKPNLAVKSKYQMWTESFRRKHYKRIRNMSYRYI